MKQPAGTPRLRGATEKLRWGVVLAAVAGLSGCAGGQVDPEDAPSVLLVTLSSVRPDHLAAYGGTHVATPTLDRLARESVRFQRAYSASPLSVPSNATLLTGLNPPAHGVHDNGSAVLPDDVRTLAERFQDAGYRTGAFTAGLGAEARWNFARGFDVFHDRTGRRPGPLDLGANRPADAVVRDTIRTLSRRSGPVFAWVNLADTTYAPPTVDGREAPGYDAGVAAMDAALGRLLSWWDRARPDSVLIVTADHGEPLGEGGETEAGALLSDGALRVPLLLRATGALADRVPVGEVIDDPVGVVDIAPTLLELASLGGRRQQMDGNDLLDEGSEAVYHEALVGWSDLGLSPLYGYTVAEGRYAEGTWGGWYAAEGNRVRLQADPSADEDRSERLAELRTARRSRVARDPALSGAELAVLVSHGFLGGDLLTPPGTFDPRDAAELLPLLGEASAAIAAGRTWLAERALAALDDRCPDTWGVVLLRASLYRAQGRLSEAVPLFAALYQRNPQASLAMQLAEVLSALGRTDEAEAWYAAVLAERPDHAEARAGLIHLALGRGDVDRAEVLLAGAVRPDPALLVAESELLLTAGRASEALALAKEARAQRPDSALAQAAVGMALWELGESDEAVRRLEDAVGTDRFNLPLREKLAGCLMALGRSTDAARLVAPARRMGSAG